MKKQNLKYKLLAVVFLAIIFSSCTGKPQTPGQRADRVLKSAKTFGLVLATAIDEGIILEAQLAADGTIDKEFEPQLRAELAAAKIAVADFNLRVSKYDTFDSASKADITKFLNDAIGFIQRANDNGLLHIKNEKKKVLASGILAGARVAVMIFQSTLNDS